VGERREEDKHMKGIMERESCFVYVIMYAGRGLGSNLGVSVQWNNKF
jgi:hypothetical protein